MVLSYLYLFQVEVHSSVFDFTHIFYRENRSFVVGSYLYTFELASSMMIYIDYSSLWKKHMYAWLHVCHVIAQLNTRC